MLLSRHVVSRFASNVYNPPLFPGGFQAIDEKRGKGLAVHRREEIPGKLPGSQRCFRSHPRRIVSLLILENEATKLIFRQRDDRDETIASEERSFLKKTLREIRDSRILLAAWRDGGLRRIRWQKRDLHGAGRLMRRYQGTRTNVTQPRRGESSLTSLPFSFSSPPALSEPSRRSVSLAASVRSSREFLAYEMREARKSNLAKVASSVHARTFAIPNL